MKTVFIDLEFCEIGKEYRKERKLSKFEIIEIGAVKLDEDHHVIEKFDAFVKPEYAQMTPFITELTGIQEKDVAKARTFEEVMDSFMAWLGNEEIGMYSWSDVDLRQIQSECRLKNYTNSKLPNLYENWVDFQMVFGKMVGVGQALSLENAVQGAGIVFVGRAHSAIVDAENTASLFALAQDPEAFEESAHQILEIMQPKPALSVSLGSLFTPEMMEMLHMERKVCA